MPQKFAKMFTSSLGGNQIRRIHIFKNKRKRTFKISLKYVGKNYNIKPNIEVNIISIFYPNLAIV